ncbi:MAG TPA: hypothetical protein ENI92_09495 [Bacteroidetes bacterium]|nr:hypothetical protein [Bacteroidota bacterium]
MTLPNFLVIGAMRTGTTTLTRLLVQHPEVFIPQQEVFFFDRYPPGEPLPLEDYAKWFEGVRGEKAVGEKSPVYLYLPWIPGRIREALGADVRLLVNLRNPIERACSHYWFNVYRMQETLTFEEAIEREEKRAAGRGHRRFRYRARGYYMRQLRPFLEVFGREKLHITLSERLYADPAGTMREVFRFLGVDDGFEVKADFKRDPPRPPKFLRLHLALSGPRVRLEKVAPARKAISGFLKLLPKYPDRGFLPMHPATRAFLRESFAGEVRELSGLLGVDLGRWWPDFAEGGANRASGEGGRHG